jgi:predicted MFS family arabinose efflux permease
LPDGIKPPALSRAAWGETLQSKALMMCVAVTILYSAGQFVLFSYFAPYFKVQLQTTPVQLSLLFAWFGAFGLIGNILMSRQIDRIGGARAVTYGVGCMALSLLLWPLGTNLMLAALIIVPWGLGCFSSNSAQQARLVGIAPALASGSIALNTSAMYAGQALGAGSGGWLIAHDGMGSLHWFGLAALLAAMAMSWWAARQRPHKSV